MATVTDIAEAGRGWRKGAGRASHAADAGRNSYATALAHSRRVRFFRKAIPVLCVVGLIGPFLWSMISPFARTVPDVSVGAVSISGSKIRMESPKLSGFRKDQRAYELTATDALQDIKQPTVVELNALVGRMEQEANSFVRVTADWGRLDQSADRLDIKGSIRIRSDRGYEADLQSARVDMKSGDVNSQEPVEIRSKTGTINADTMIIRENGKVSVFEGRVRSVFIHDEQRAEAAGGTKAP
jgi:lipopolysaccharide export system protein LptC